MLTFLTRFLFISTFFASLITSAFAENSTAPSNTLQQQANTQLPEWVYRELSSIQKEMSVIDANGATKESVQELKERIRILETEVKLSETRIGDIYASTDRFGIIAGILGVIIAAIAFFFSSNAKREAIESAKEEAGGLTSDWIENEEKKISKKFDKQIEAINYRFDEELKAIKENAEIESVKTVVTRGISLLSVDLFSQAIDEFNIVIKKYSINAKLELKEQIAMSFKYKGFALGRIHRMDEAITTYGTMVDYFRHCEEEELRKIVESIFSERAELILSTKNQLETKNAITEAISFMGNRFSVNRVVMELFNYIIEETDLDSVTRLIDRIPSDEKLMWEFSVIRSVIQALESPRKEYVTALARFFESHKDKAKLREELDKIQQKL